MSIDHPFAVQATDLAAGRKTRYLATYSRTEQWTLQGHSYPMSFWHRPLHATTAAFTANGFQISVVSEPQPDPATRELFPDEFRSASAVPGFLFFVLHAE